MKSGKTIGARACMQAQPARTMGSMRARTISDGRRGLLRRHDVGSAALAARKEHAKCAVPQPDKTHGKCAPGATAGVIRSIPMSFAHVATSRYAVRSAQAAAGIKPVMLFIVCVHARCAEAGAIAPSPIVSIAAKKPSAANLGFTPWIHTLDSCAWQA